MSRTRNSRPVPAQGRDGIPDSAAFFDAQVDRWSGLYSRKASFVDRLALFNRAVRESVPVGGRVLDVGCGTGNIALAIAETGIEVLGVDGAPKMIAEAERAGRGIKHGEFRVADLSSATFDAEAYDAVVCSSVLEYIEDDALLLERMAKTLRPGGVLLLSVPSASSFLGRMEDMLARHPAYTNSIDHQYLLFSRRRYGVKALRKALARAGLEWSRSVLFEIPVPGRPGIALSRLPFLGVLRLIVAHKRVGSVRMARSTGLQRKGSARPHALSRKNIWEACPSSVKDLVGVVLGCVPTRMLLGRRFRETLRFVQNAQWWSAEQIKAYQLAELRRICKLAYEKTTFYRQAFDAVGFRPEDLSSTDALAVLPLIDKRTLRDHTEDMCAVPPTSRGIDCVSTGGSSGEPLSFYIGAGRSGIEYAYLVTSWARTGYRLRIPEAVFRGQVVEENRTGLRHSYDPILRRHYYSSFHMTDDYMRRSLAHVATLGPVFLHGYPSSLTALTRYIQRSGVTVPSNICGLLAGSEMVYSAARANAERVFGVRYFSYYGHSEKLVLAAECEHSTDYHVWPTYGYVELLDDHGNLVTTPGQRGEIVGTGFINRVMPFIRYRTGDYAEYVGASCSSCGREHMILRDIRGHRTQEQLVAKDGTEIPWTALNMHDDTFDRVSRFQFYQDTPGVAVLRIVPASGFCDDDQVRILRNLDRKIEGRIKIEITLTDSIPVSARGKAIYVDQHIPTTARRVAESQSA
ncbi:MAG: methyltransferase domain-containing protein [Planctomycetes bacterium]|nr:methyltransferase domain-containing protein [Planctomycetota bacterium]